MSVSGLGGRPRLLVATVVHHPDDARIRHREICALLEAGWDVSYAAPFGGYGLPVPRPAAVGRGRLRCLDVPRARGRRRVAALVGAARLLRGEGPHHDLVLIHDPELLLVAPRTGARVVWDVHEDTAAALRHKAWLPAVLRTPAAAAVVALERSAERRHPLVLAEYRYQDRFRRTHPVVPNAVTVPESVPVPGTDRVVYLGSVTLERGAEELVALGRNLRERTGGAVAVEVIGPAHGAAEPLMARALARGDVRWPGFVPSDRALLRLEGALAGVSLLRDVPNYRHSMPTKVVEYMAHGLPVVTTPLPLAVDLVTRAGAGVVVPFESPEDAADAVLALREDSARARALGAAGHRAALESYDWRVLADGFVQSMADYARVPSAVRSDG